MASYALLNAFSGFEFDMVTGMIGFKPANSGESCFRCFWSLDPGWGLFEKAPGLMEIKVLYGGLKIKLIKLPADADEQIKAVELSGKPVGFKCTNGTILLDSETVMAAGGALTIKV
jgi:hypothetical protein